MVEEAWFGGNMPEPGRRRERRSHVFQMGKIGDRYSGLGLAVLSCYLQIHGLSGQNRQNFEIEGGGNGVPSASPSDGGSVVLADRLRGLSVAS